MSLEEVLIALRDDTALRHDPERPLRGNAGGGEGEPQAPVGSLYPDGFSAQRFVEVIEAGPCGQRCRRRPAWLKSFGARVRRPGD